MRGSGSAAIRYLDVKGTCFGAAKYALRVRLAMTVALIPVHLI